MTDPLPVAYVESATAVSSGLTGGSFTLASTTVGDLNVVTIGGTVGSGTEVTALTVSQPGWTVSYVDTDSNGLTASSGSWVALLWKVREASDSGSTVTVSWSAAAAANPTAVAGAISIAAGSFDSTNPVPYAITLDKAVSNTSYPISGTTPAGMNGVLYFGAASRTDTTAWSSATDTLVGKANAGADGSSNTSTVLYQAGLVAGGTAFSKTITGANTSVGMAFAFLVKSAPSGPTVVESWLAQTTFYCAHRGGSFNWVEMTSYAYDHASAWNSKLALEFSAWRTSDGVWVGSHDQNTSRVFGVSYDIPTTTWATLSALRTTNGSYPMLKLVDFLQTYGGSRVLFIDNKSGTNNSEFLDLIDTYQGPESVVIKAFNTAVSLADAATARGYQTWGYFYQTDVPNLPSNAPHYSILGMDYNADSSSWTAVMSYGKPVMGHIINSTTAKTTALGYGADGLMVSDVMDVVPAESGATIHAKDTFARTTSGGWGTAEIGGNWTGTTYLSTDGSQGVLTFGAVGQGNTPSLNSVSAKDVDLVFDFKVNQHPTAAPLYLTPHIRGQATAYKPKVRIQSGAYNLQWTKNVGAGDVNIDAGYTLLLSGVPDGTWIRFRFQVFGNSPATLRGRAWIIGNPEPSTWVQNTDTDAALVNAGSFSLENYISAASEIIPVINIDNLYMYEYGAAPVKPVATISADKTTDVEPWSTVTLTLNESSSGTIATRTFRQISGTTVSVTGTPGPAATLTFEAPGTLAGDTLVFGYKVNDGTDSDEATVSIQVLPVTERVVIGGVEVPARLYIVSN